MASLPTVKPEDTVAPINRIMSRYQLRPELVCGERRYQVVPGVGDFACGCCGHFWRSRFSWMRIDLFDQMVTYKWAMKCQHCWGVEKPTFSTGEAERMMEKAVCKYLGHQYPEGGGRRGGGPRPAPHIPLLCEKCGWGQTQCWGGRPQQQDENAELYPTRI